MRYRLTGNWEKGLAFDLHTLASTYLGPDESGYDRWDTTRSEMGALIYRLKYAGDKTVIPDIVKLLGTIKGIETFDVLIPVPSSKMRAVQPVDEIASALGRQRGVPVLNGYLQKSAPGPALKDISASADRAKILKDAIKISDNRTIEGKNVLLIDDLYRSGATLEACTSVLYEQARAGSVCVLTMTKTRSKR